MNHTHPEYLEFVGEQIKEKRRIIEFLVASNDKRVEADLSAWLAIHDGLVAHDRDPLDPEYCLNCVTTKDEYWYKDEFPCWQLKMFTKHLDKVMG